MVQTGMNKHIIRMCNACLFGRNRGMGALNPKKHIYNVKVHMETACFFSCNFLHTRHTRHGHMT